jgi:hypothetical protein
VTSIAATEVGRFARAALDGGIGEVCALFRRSFYLRCPGDRYACVGARSLGRGPLNALVARLEPPKLGERLSISLEGAELWTPAAFESSSRPSLAALREIAASKAPAEGFGCLIAGKQNALASHAQPALEALDAWLAGHALGDEAAMLVGLGPGLTPSGDDYLGGMLVALRACGRGSRADSLWRWLEPRVPRLTSPISGAHLAAAAAGEGHEALHLCLARLFANDPQLDDAIAQLDAVGHCSGWDALAGAVAVLKTL